MVHNFIYSTKKKITESLNSRGFCFLLDKKNESKMLSSIIARFERGFF